MPSLTLEGVALRLCPLSTFQPTSVTTCHSALFTQVGIFWGCRSAGILNGAIFCNTHLSDRIPRPLFPKHAWQHEWGPRTYNMKQLLTTPDPSWRWRNNLELKNVAKSMLCCEWLSGCQKLITQILPLHFSKIFIKCQSVQFLPWVPTGALYLVLNRGHSKQSPEPHSRTFTPVTWQTCLTTVGHLPGTARNALLWNRRSCLC